MAVTKQDGGDFMVGNSGPKTSKAVKIHNSGDLDIDAAVALMDSKKDGEALRSGLDKAVSALDALRKTGLTGEALVVLVHAKCERKQGMGQPPSVHAVQSVLEGLFKLGDYVR